MATVPEWVKQASCIRTRPPAQRLPQVIVHIHEPRQDDLAMPRKHPRAASRQMLADHADAVPDVRERFLPPDPRAHLHLAAADSVVAWTPTRWRRISALPSLFGCSTSSGATSARTAFTSQ